MNPPPTIKKNDRLDNVHSRAVTEFKEDVFVFRWDVRNFKERLDNKDPKKAILESPLFNFYFEEESKTQRQWKLQLKWSCTEKNDNSTENDTFLSVYLFLTNSKEKEAILTTYQVDLLDSEEKSGRKLSADREFAKSTPGWGWEKYLNTRYLLDPKNKLLEDNTLKVQCRIMKKQNVQHQLSPLKARTGRHASNPKSPMISDFSSMFTSSILTDVLIKTKGSTLKAHKAILSWRSPVFLAMFQSEMAESIQNVVEIVDFEDDIVKWMVEYIYGVEISQEVLTENSLELFQIAQKYDISGLKDLVGDVLALNLSVKTVVDTLILADMYCVLNLKARAIKFMNMNKEAVMKSDDFHKILTYNNSSIFKELYTHK